MVAAVYAKVKVNYCQRKCVSPRFGINGTPNKAVRYYGQSMYSLGYIYCDVCRLWFTKDSQRSETGFVRNCKCCHNRLRFKASSGRKHNKQLDTIRDAKRY